jgi:chromosome transmission fidelity protein 8
MIGHHLLDGKFVNLPKHLAVLHRHATDQQPPSADMDLAPDTGTLIVGSSQQEGIAWDMIAIVKRKIVFSKRPMPIVGLGSTTSTLQ